MLYSIGISATTVDSVSTGIKALPSERANVTNSLGLVFENHTYHFGVFIGWDKLSLNDFTDSKWRYQNKPWLSVGLGTSIFTGSSKKSKIKLNKRQPIQVRRKFIKTAHESIPQE